MLDDLKKAAAMAQAKIAKQRQEIARLTREVEQLRADKALLRFDLAKAQVAVKQYIEERSK